MKPFRIGFTGTTLDELLPWADQQVGDADRVVVAMAGSGKDIAYLAREGRTILSWDTQYLSKCIVDGVFSQPKDEMLELLDWGGATGYAARFHPIHGVPKDAERLIDWIAIEGTDFDRACLAQAVVRSTYMGRLRTWGRDGTAADLYAAYARAHKRLQEWRGLPGTFVHTLGSVFDYLWLDDDTRDAVLFVDTPKVLTPRKKGGDIYSQGFVGLNSILAQTEQVLPAWTEDTFRRDMPTLFRAPWSRMLLFHASGCLPSISQVAELMKECGLAVDTALYETWEHKGRTDVCWVLPRHHVVSRWITPPDPTLLSSKWL